jgi:hypothetical protein
LQNGRNTGDAENRIQQRTIFRAKARDFSAQGAIFCTLPIILCTLAREFGFERARAASGRDVAPDLAERYFQGHFVLRRGVALLRPVRRFRAGSHVRDCGMHESGARSGGADKLHHAKYVWRA